MSRNKIQENFRSVDWASLDNLITEGYGQIELTMSIHAGNGDKELTQVLEWVKAIRAASLKAVSAAKFSGIYKPVED
jgi:hypothetical protein